MLTVFRTKTIHIFLLWLFGNSAVVLTVATPHCVRAPAWIPSWNLMPTHQLLSCVLSPALFNLPEPYDSWLPWVDIFYYLLHVSKAMRHLSISAWLVSLNTVSYRFFPVVISSFLGPFLWVCECFMKQCFIGHPVVWLLPWLSCFDKSCMAVVQSWSYCLMNWFQFLCVYTQYWDSWITYYFSF